MNDVRRGNHSRLPLMPAVRSIRFRIDFLLRRCRNPCNVRALHGV